MRTLRSTLCTLYAIIGALVLVGSIATAPEILSGVERSPGMGLFLAAIGLLLPASACLFLLAAIAYWRRWRAARVLCIAVGVMNILVFGAFLFVSVALIYFFPRLRHDLVPGLSMNIPLLLLGVVSIVGFGWWNPAKEPPVKRTDRRARKGDGTWSWWNRSYVVAEYVAFFLIWSWLGTWASKAGIPFTGFGTTLFWVMLATIAVVTVHEAGHALCGLALAYKLRGFYAGPFQWRHMEGRWTFALKPMGFINTGGAAAVVSPRLHEPRWKDMCIVAAGPGVNLVTGPVALWFAAQMTHGTWERYWFPVAAFGVISLMTVVFNLLPVRAGVQYSDGARLYQALRGGVWYEMYEIYNANAATALTARRPRDQDIDAIQRVLRAGVVLPLHELLLHMFAYTYYLDRSMPEEADTELRLAEAALQESESLVSPLLLTYFVRHEAMARRDASRARQWWDRMTQKKLPRMNADYWMAESALCWVEGRKEQSQTAWRRAEERLEQMPDTGTYAFDRDQLAKLKQVIGSASPVGEPEPVA